MNTTKKRYDLILFDLDGTTLDTIADLTDAVNRMLTRRGFPTRSTAEVRAFLGNGSRRLTELSLPTGATAEEIDEATAEFLDCYRAHCNVKTIPYAGIPELMDDLRAVGCRLAVISNKDDEMVQALCGQFFGDRLDFCVGARADTPRKPVPDSVLRIIERAGVTRERAVLVGDSEVDVQTAKNAGIDCIAVSWGFRAADVLRAAGARVLAESVAELRNDLL